MKVSQIIFSPTGGTKKVADAITNTWGLPVNEIDLSNAETDYSSLSFEKMILRLLQPRLLANVFQALPLRESQNIHGSHTPV